MASTLAWAAPAQATTQTFNFTGAEQTFTVPDGVFHLKVELVGGTGGAAGAVSGGEAADVTTGLSVSPGETVYIEVGGRGESELEGGVGGFNGGGNGAGGGGGASDIRTAPRSMPLATKDTRLVVAGGGGGAGATGEETGGKGGAASESGEGSSGYFGGGPGTQTEGGEGAFGCLSEAPDGELGEGGDGGAALVSTGPGGGGGGGFYGGGGGAGACSVGSSGGGGGSSLASGGLESLTSAQPKITISYNPPPTVEIVSPSKGATYTQGNVVNASYSCLPGEGTTLKSCTGPVANGGALDTSTVGKHEFTVNAEDNDAGKASESVTYTVLAKKEEPHPGPGPSPAPAVAPNTILGSHPKKTIKTAKRKVKVKFSFSSSAAGASFKCKLDKGAFTPCASPKTYKVKLGKHTFSVEAVDATGADRTPATFAFKVKKKS